MIFMNDLKDYKSAIADLSKSIELGETYPKLFKGWVYWGLPHRGECYMKLKDYRKAIEDFSKYLEIRKGNETSYVGDIYKLRGKCYAALGETAKAQADFAKAKSLR